MAFDFHHLSCIIFTFSANLICEFMTRSGRTDHLSFVSSLVAQLVSSLCDYVDFGFDSPSAHTLCNSTDWYIPAGG
jgi:hypothetical protein